MTEAEWLICTDSAAMLDFLHRKARRSRFKVSDRKYRLFFCARCRERWKMLMDKRSRRAVEIAEQFADGLVGLDELREAEKQAREASTQAFHGNDTDIQSVAIVAFWTTFQDAENRACAEISCADDYDQCWQEEAADYPDRNATARQVVMLKLARQLEQANHAELFHDLLGNPFRPTKKNPSWESAKVVQLAQTIYKKRAFERMAELADALEQAGCRSTEVLAHCRHPRRHVRGCWLVDLILGKE